MMSGSSSGTGTGIMWFCHICHWTGVLPPGTPHKCGQAKP